MRNYCTLFDRNYLQKGLTMYESLRQRSSEEFTLHILSMDNETSSILYELQLPNTETLPLGAFEYSLHMEPIKASRSWQEYCWTCASSLMEYLMPWMNADGVTYLDADLIFFSDPRVLFEEIGSLSIGITPHRFPAHRKHMEVNGIYNVGLVHAKNTHAGKACIARWAAQCREWCFNRVEPDHACGDQKYLDEFPLQFPGDVCSIANVGVNLAPWNIEQYRITAGPNVDDKPVVFYHLHEFKGPTDLTRYAMREEDLRFIYAPYVQAWQAAGERIAAIEIVLEESRLRLELQSQRA